MSGRPLLAAAFLWMLACVPAAHADIYAARTFPPYTITSTNFAPGPNGESISGYDGDCSAELVLTSGTISVNIEASLTGSGAFVNMGTVTTNSLTSIRGPIDAIRFNPTACSSCLATAVIRCRSAQ